MRLIEIIPSEGLVLIDGTTLKIDFTVDDNYRGIYWDESVKTGFIEVYEGEGKTISSFDDFKEIVEAFKAKLEAKFSTDYKLSIIPDDKLVDVDGVAHELDFDIDPNYHAIFWDGKEGFIETKQGRNIKIYDLDGLEHLVDLHAAETKKINDKRKAEEDEFNAPANVIKREIIKLENEITPRRLREAVLTQDGADWLNEQEGLIEQKRTELSALAE